MSVNNCFFSLLLLQFNLDSFHIWVKVRTHEGANFVGSGILNFWLFPNLRAFLAKNWTFCKIATPPRFFIGGLWNVAQIMFTHGSKNCRKRNFELWPLKNFTAQIVKILKILHLKPHISKTDNWISPLLFMNINLRHSY